MIRLKYIRKSCF